MTQTLAAPLAPFADALPVPRRLVAAEQNGRLSVPIRAGAHRFHRDLPESVIWGYDGTVPGPTIEAERGQPVTVRWRNELDGALPVVVTTAPVAADTSGVPVQCVRAERRRARPERGRTGWSYGRAPARRAHPGVI
jgi:FtsP/CotA-like multicopper oxidase with cupredoxin domain